MALPTFYSTGVASVLNGATTVIGTGTGWGGDVLLSGDLFMDPAQPGVPPQRIASVTNGTHIELAVGWPGADMVAAAYEVRFVGNIERSTAQTRRYLEMLGQVSALGVQPNAFGEFTDRAAYDDAAAGYIFLSLDGDGVTGVWTLYTKLSATSGDWSDGQTVEGREGRQGNPGLIGDWRGAWAPGTYNELDAVEHNGSAYIVKVGVVSTTQEPPASDWELVAARGGEGLTAYEVAVAEGFVGDEAAWLSSLGGADGLGVPPGGTTGQVLRKASNADNDTVWEDGLGVPAGGTTGQVLKKASNADGDAVWGTPTLQESVLAGANIYQITGNLKHKGLTVQIFPTTVDDGPGSQGNKKWVIVWREGVAHGYDGNSVIKAADSYDQGHSLQNIRVIWDEAGVDARDFSGAIMNNGRIGLLVTRELGATSFGKPMFLYSDDKGVTWGRYTSVASSLDGLSFDEYLHNIPAELGGGPNSWVGFGWINPTRTSVAYLRTDDNGQTWSHGTAVATVAGEDWSEPRVVKLGDENKWVMVIRRNQAEGLNALISTSTNLINWTTPIDSGQQVGRNPMTLLCQDGKLHWFVFSRPYATEAMSIGGRRDALLVQSRNIDEVWADLDDWPGWETFATMFRPLGYMKFVEDSGKTYGIFPYNEREKGDNASYTALAILTDDPAFNQLGAMSGGNAFGNWTAYPDGRLECYGKITTTITCAAYAGLFLSEDKHLAYPHNPAIKFAAQPSVQVWVRSSSARAWPTASGNPLNAMENLSLQFLSPVATASQSLTFDYRAVGTWS